MIAVHHSTGPIDEQVGPKGDPTVIPPRQPATGSGKEGSYRPEPSEDIRKLQPSQGHLKSLSYLIEESEHLSDEERAGRSDRRVYLASQPRLPFPDPPRKSKKKKSNR
jgi:hypothetical protein